MSTKYAGSSYNCVTREEILNQLNNTEELKQKVKENNKIQEEYHNQWKENLSEEENHEESFEQLLAAEEASTGKFFHRIIEFHQRWLQRALQKPLGNTVRSRRL